MTTPFIFFGTSEFSVIVLETFRGRGMLPHAIVTTPDRPQGRHMIVTPPPTKKWAQVHGIKVFQFEKLDADAVATLQNERVNIFVVASYGKIIPQSILNIPLHGALNIHPSLLPKYRGASPLQSMILADDMDTGVTIIKMDALMDHGPIVAQQKVAQANWPVSWRALEHSLAISGAQLLADNIERYILNVSELKEQKHEQATFTKKIVKEDGLIDITKDRESYLKYQAYLGWPGVFFYTERKGKNIRVAIKEAKFEDDTFIITRVTPEGGKEISYEEFKKGL